MCFLVCVAIAFGGCGCTEKAADPQPTESQALVIEGRQYLANRDFKRARVTFKEAIVADPSDPGGRLGLIALGLATGDKEQVLESLNVLQTKGIDPQAHAPWLVALVPAMAMTSETAPDGSQTRPLASKAAEKTTTASKNDNQVSRAFAAGAYQQVIDVVSKKHDPDPKQLQMLAESHYNLGQWQKAVTAYRHVLRQNPGDEQVIQYLADALMRLERYDECMAFYRILAESRPDKPGYWRLVGDAAVKKGDNGVAFAAYTKALDGGFKAPGLEEIVAVLRHKIAKEKQR